MTKAVRGNRSPPAANDRDAVNGGELTNDSVERAPVNTEHKTLKDEPRTSRWSGLPG